MANAHQTWNLPRCKLPGCEKQAIFDPRINEQREFCEVHIGHAIHVGFAGPCLACESMPARLDSKFCSDACRRLGARAAPGPSSTTTGYFQPTGFVQPAVLPLGQPTPQPPVHSHVRREPAVQPAPPIKLSKSWKGDYSVPEGLAPTCQECRGPIKGRRDHYCSKACEEENRRISSGSRFK
jgi:hypothetical protein